MTKVLINDCFIFVHISHTYCTMYTCIVVHSLDLFSSDTLNINNTTVCIIIWLVILYLHVESNLKWACGVSSVFLFVPQLNMTPTTKRRGEKLEEVESQHWQFLSLSFITRVNRLYHLVLFCFVFVLILLFAVHFCLYPQQRYNKSNKC